MNADPLWALAPMFMFATMAYYSLEFPEPARSYFMRRFLVVTVVMTLAYAWQLVRSVVYV